MNDKNSDSSATERLSDAYHRMMDRVKSAIEDAEDRPAPSLEELLGKAQEKAVELGELTREEAQKVADYLKRDMQDAGHYLTDTGTELRGWLSFDLELIEDRILDLFSRVADKTRLEILEFEHDVKEGPTYRAGEIAGPGTLCCVSCGEEIPFYKAELIPACPKCQGTEFERRTG